jgi:hypothetical protein
MSNDQATAAMFSMGGFYTGRLHVGVHPINQDLP